MQPGDLLNWQATPSYTLGGLDLLLGVWVLVKASSRATRLLGAFLLVLAGLLLAEGLVASLSDAGDYPSAGLFFTTESALNWVAAVILVWFMLEFPTRTGSPLQRRALLGAVGALAALSFLALLAGSPPVQVSGAGNPHISVVAVNPSMVVTYFGIACVALTAFVLSGRLPQATEPNARRSLQLVVLGLLAFGLARSAREADQQLTFALRGTPGFPGLLWFQVGTLLLVLVLPLACIAWWRLARQATSWGTRTALALFAATSFYLGVAANHLWLPSPLTITLEFAPMPIVVAYAALRLKLPGFDRRVRWTLSRGAIAAFLLLVFLVVSQVIENVAPQTFGPWVGAAASGLCLFGLRPLQRVADRFASAAVPDMGPPPASAQADQAAEDVYRTTLRKYLADGRMTRDEERHLAHLSSKLGIGAVRAVDLRHETETQLAAAQTRGRRPKGST